MKKKKKKYVNLQMHKIMNTYRRNFCSFKSNLQLMHKTSDVKNVLKPIIPKNFWENVEAKLQ